MEWILGTVALGGLLTLLGVALGARIAGRR